MIDHIAKRCNEQPVETFWTQLARIAPLDDNEGEGKIRSI